MESKSVVYIFYESRGMLVVALEWYQTRYLATHTLPQWCESGNVVREEIDWLSEVLAVVNDERC